MPCAMVKPGVQPNKQKNPIFIIRFKKLPRLMYASVYTTVGASGSTNRFQVVAFEILKCCQITLSLIANSP